MAPRIEIRNLTGKRIPPRRSIKKAITKTLKLHRKRAARVNIVFLKDSQIKKLNLKYKGKNRPTDVLAFGMQEGKCIKGCKGLLGDIAVSVDAAKRQAKDFGTTKKRELYLYIIHGTLHLLGYDDTTGRGFKRMQAKETRILNSIWNSIT